MRLLLAAIGVLIAIEATGSSVPAFFGELYAEFEPLYVHCEREAYSEFCLANGLDSTSEGNRRVYHELLFVHELLTGAEAVDCTRGGILGIPYFWHWVDPNPRHSICALPESIALSAIPPPPAFKRYRSFADIDRVPTLFFVDLVSDVPRYFHDGCGRFFTFGWCSEREMAYLALAESLGYTGRICQSGIHSWSEIWCALETVSGESKELVARIDNTFGVVEWVSVPVAAGVAAWQDAPTSFQSAGWYNHAAHSAATSGGLSAIEVGQAAAARIRSLVRDALDSEPGVRGLPSPH